MNRLGNATAVEWFVRLRRMSAALVVAVLALGANATLATADAKSSPTAAKPAAVVDVGAKDASAKGAGAETTGAENADAKNVGEKSPGVENTGTENTEAKARDLLDAMGFEDVLRQMIVLVNDQSMAEERESGDRALLQRWLAATQLQAISAQTARGLAAQANAGQIEQALSYFRSPAGKTELGCVRDAAGSPVLTACIEERGGKQQLQAHQAFAETAIEHTLGDVLGESFGPPLFEAIAAAKEADAALKREVEAYCKRRPTGLCAMVASTAEGANPPGNAGADANTSAASGGSDA